MAIKLQIKPELGWGGRTAGTWALRAGGIRRPHPRLSSGGRGCGSAWSLYAICPAPRSFKNRYSDSENDYVTGYRFDRKHMIKNQRRPLYKHIIPDSEVSDGTRPVCADSEARPERFLQKRNFISGRADKILYFPIPTFGRGDSVASRRFDTWGHRNLQSDKGLEYIESKKSYITSYIPESDIWSRGFGCFTPIRRVGYRNLQSDNTYRNKTVNRFQES